MLGARVGDVVAHCGFRAFGENDPALVKSGTRRWWPGTQLADAYRQAGVADETATLPLLEALVVHLGESSFVKSPLYVYYGKNISIRADLADSPERAVEGREADRRCAEDPPRTARLSRAVRSGK